MSNMWASYRQYIGRMGNMWPYVALALEPSIGHIIFDRYIVHNVTHISYFWIYWQFKIAMRPLDMYTQWTLIRVERVPSVSKSYNPISQFECNH